MGNPTFNNHNQGNVTINSGKHSASNQTIYGPYVPEGTSYGDLAMHGGVIHKSTPTGSLFNQDLHGHLVPPTGYLLEGLKQDKDQLKFLKEQKLITVAEGSATSILKLETILGSVIMTEGVRGAEASGTAFLLKTPEGVALVSAGHVFWQFLFFNNGVCSADFRKLKLLFGNMNGSKEGEEAVKLLALGSVRGSIGKDGKRWFLPSGVSQDSAPGEDYCFLLLDITEGELREMGLSCLECGEGDYLGIKHGDVCSIYGHPGGNAREGQAKSCRPLRISYGIERDGAVVFPADKFQEKSKRAHHYFDYDSLAGNSGSPVIGRGSGGSNYAVKAIHILGCERQVNGAQSLQAWRAWIEPAMELKVSTSVGVSTPLFSARCGSSVNGGCSNAAAVCCVDNCGQYFCQSCSETHREFLGDHRVLDILQ